MAASDNAKISLWADFAKFKKLWPYLRQNSKQLFATLPLIPLISVLQLYQPILLKHAIDDGILKHDHNQLLHLATFYLVLVIAEWLTRSTQSLSSTFIVERMIRRLRGRIVHHVLHLAPAFHDQSMSGALVTRATSDCDNLSESLNQGILQSLVDVVVLCGVVVGMFLLDPYLGAVTLVILPLTFLLIVWFSRAIKEAMLNARRHLAMLNAFTQECLSGITTIKVLTAEKAAEKRYHGLNLAFRDAQMRSVTFDAFLYSMLEGMASITVGVVLWLVISHFFGFSFYTAGVTVAFVRYIQQLFEPLKTLGQTLSALQGVFTSIDRVFTVLETQNHIGGDRPAFDIKGHIEFQDVGFAYRRFDDSGHQPTPILKQVSFQVPPGSSCAIVGLTGGGKSTMMKLLTKLYDGYSGEIRIDGEDLRRIEPFSLRKKISIVPQEIVLFNDTIRFNIGMGADDVTQDMIERAAGLVGADAFIQGLEGGYDFKVAENGENLSEGQKQLIAFARALVHNPGLVVLDEATSSIDPQSESAIQRAIGNMLAGRTVLIIAHRLATVKRCDNILVVEDGRIVEEGTHPVLLAKQGAYHQLHESLA